MEGVADHKAELVDLAKNGNYSLYFSVCVYVKYIYVYFLNKLQMNTPFKENGAIYAI